MQPLARLRHYLSRLADPEHYIFSSGDLRSLFPEQSDSAYRALMSRAVTTGVVERVCRGIFINPYAAYERGFELLHTAARLRADHLTYISLETALSDLGLLSQVPLGRIMLMSTGRTSTVRCGRFGTIELVHTKRRPDVIASELVYDERARLWRATARLAVRDIRAVGRSLDLIDWSAIDEFV